MSFRWTIVWLTIGVLGFGVLPAIIPGSPVWRLLNPAKTVTFVDPDGVNSAGIGSTGGRELKIVPLLPKDGILALLGEDLVFVTGAEANDQMQPSDRIIGVSVNGDNRAYSTAHLSSHEVVNDTVGGVPVAVTW